MVNLTKQHVYAAGALYFGTVGCTYLYFKSHNNQAVPVVTSEAASCFDSLATTYDTKIGSEERVLGYGLLRWWMLSQAEGSVLEISAGTGRNFKHYNYSKIKELTVCDVSKPMLNVAEAKYYDELQINFKHKEHSARFCISDAHCLCVSHTSEDEPAAAGESDSTAPPSSAPSLLARLWRQVPATRHTSPAGAPAASTAAAAMAASDHYTSNNNSRSSDTRDTKSSPSSSSRHQAFVSGGPPVPAAPVASTVIAQNGQQSPLEAADQASPSVASGSLVSPAAHTPPLPPQPSHQAVAADSGRCAEAGSAVVDSADDGTTGWFPYSRLWRAPSSVRDADAPTRDAACANIVSAAAAVRGPCSCCGRPAPPESERDTSLERCQRGGLLSGEPLRQFAEQSFDTVVDTFGLCSHDDPVQVLKQVARVCRPDGQIILLEHGRSSWEWLNEQLDSSAEKHHDKWACWWNRDILGICEEAGLQLDSVTRWHFGTTYLIKARPSHRDDSNANGVLAQITAE